MLFVCNLSTWRIKDTFTILSQSGTHRHNPVTNLCDKTLCRRVSSDIVRSVIGDIERHKNGRSGAKLQSCGENLVLAASMRTYQRRISSGKRARSRDNGRIALTGQSLSSRGGGCSPTGSCSASSPTQGHFQSLVREEVVATSPRHL